MSIKKFLHRLNRRDLPLLPKPLAQIFIVLLVVFGVLITNKIVAADRNVIKETQEAIKKGDNQEAWLNNSFSANAVATQQALMGEIDFDQIKIDADGKITMTENYVPSGMIGHVNNLISQTFTPPISGTEYIAYSVNNFFGKSAYAQGVAFKAEDGNGSLRPLLKFWTQAKNTVYMIFSLIFIVYAFFIIFRVKVSNQAVVSLQSALPGLITSLVLVTFSYAIAGLIIDLSYVVTGLVVYYFAQLPDFKLLNGVGLSNGYIEPNLLINPSFDKVIGMTFSMIPAIALISLSQLVGSVIVGTLVNGAVNMLTLNVGGGWAGYVVGKSVGKWTGYILGSVGGLLVIVIVSILCIFWLIKLFFGLLKTYVTLIVRIMIGPFEIAMGAFPNSKIGFSSWATNVVAGIAVFPAVVIFLLFANYLEGVIRQSGVWMPTMLSETGVNSANVISAGIGLVALSMLSKLPEVVPQAIFNIKPSPYGNAIGKDYAPVGQYLGKAGDAGIDYGKNWLDKSTFGKTPSRRQNMGYNIIKGYNALRNRRGP